MKLNIKKALFLSVMLFTFIIPVKANSIKQIDMDVYINENGDAHIKEVWNASLTEGTEGYKPYSDMGISKITDFKVSDNDTTYTYVDSWNTSASFSQKAQKNGIHYISNGLELCFGISKYGSDRTYTLEYTITDFVTKYKDSQGIYFTFIDMNQYIGSAKVTISSYVPYSIEENVKIWGFGHKGETKIEDGKIVIYTTSSMKSSDYLSALVKFDQDLYTTNKTSDKSFDDIYKSAMEGVSAKDKILDKASKNAIWLIIILIVFNPSMWITIPLIIFLIYMSKKRKASLKDFLNRKYDGYFKYKDGKVLPTEINPFRDLPCNKDLFYGFWLGNTYDINRAEVRKGLIGALFLKWFKEKRIEINQTSKSIFNFKDNNYAISFTSNAPENETEKKLYDMLMEAASTNNVLEPDELKKWSIKNYNKLSSWYNSVGVAVVEMLKANELMVPEQEVDVDKKGNTRTITANVITTKVYEEAIKLAGLRKFLSDTSIDEKRYIEVHLWNEYLMFAELLGVADKVREQFGKLYPDLTEQLANFKVADSIATAVSAGYSIGYNRSVSSSYSGSSRSSGGGGHSYSSGGHSSSGSHGGGFR